MKKIFNLIMVSLFLLSLFGCGNNSSQTDNSNDEQSQKPNDEQKPTEGNNQDQGGQNSDQKPTVEREVSVDYENLTIYVPSERNIRIAQFADLHFSVETYGGYANDKEERTKAFMKQMVDETDPDLIVLSGDNLYGRSTLTGLNVVENAKRLIAYMETLKTPYAFIYGNHDAEEITDGSNKKALNDYLLSCNAKYLLYGNECPETTGSDYRDIRYGTYAIKLCDLDSRDLTGTIVMFDSGYNDERISSYNSISQTQIDWYENKIKTLQKEYKGNGVIPSIIFNHIQLPQFYNAYVTAYMRQFPEYSAFGNSSYAHYQYSEYMDGYDTNPQNEHKFVLFQDVTKINDDDNWVYSIKRGAPTNPTTNLWSKMVELGSTKAYFSGHAHKFTFQVKSLGIVLGFAPQTGFAPAESFNWNPRIGYVYNFNTSLDLIGTDIVNEDESDVLGTGLLYKYMDKDNGDRIGYIENSSTPGVYTFDVEMKVKWSRFKLYYAGELISLSGEGAYKVSGTEYSSSYVTDGRLYLDMGVFIYAGNTASVKKVTVDTINKTIVIGDSNQPVQTNLAYEFTQGVDTSSVSYKEVNGVSVLTFTTSGRFANIILSYKGKELSPSSVTVEGAYRGNAWYDDIPNYVYYEGGSGADRSCWVAYDLDGKDMAQTYEFQYNPQTNKLTITVK